jgi:pilus assembly protein CpaD
MTYKKQHRTLNKSACGLIILTCLLNLSSPIAMAKEKAPKAVNSKVQNALTPGSQFRLDVTTQVETVPLRAHVTGLSDNQKKALDGIAARAGWANDRPISLEVISSHAPGALKSAQEVRYYLLQRGVADTDVSLIPDPAQTEDIIGVNIVTYSLKPIACGQRWDNLAASGANAPDPNFGCSLSANLAAMINDPRHVSEPAASTPVDVNRRNVIMQKYREGKVTSSDVNDASSAKISQAVK